MNIMELKRLVDQALDRGIDPNTTVVIAHREEPGDWAILREVGDPAEPGNSYESHIWFTLYPGEEADGRFTPGHFQD